MNSFFRQASPNERVYIHAQELFSPLNIQCFFEGSGRLTATQLQKAVDTATEVCPGARLVYAKKKWLDSGQIPIVQEVENNLFDGYNFEVLELRTNLLHTKGPPIEVLLVSGRTYGILFRVFHGIMDGKGVLLWVENIFRALRGEEVVAIPSRHSDLSFIQELDYKKFNSLQFPSKKIMEDVSSIGYTDIETHRITITGNYGSLVPKLMKSFASLFCDAVSFFMVPVSLRTKDLSVRSTANLVLPIFIEVSKEDSIQEINQRFIQKLKEDEFLNIANAKLGVLGYVPDLVMKVVLWSYAQLCRTRSVFSTSGVISYVGHYDLATFSCTDFRCSTFYSIPLLTPFSPVSVVAYKNNHAMEVSVSYNASVFSKEKRKEISQVVYNAITERDVYSELNHTRREVEEGTILDGIMSTIHEYRDDVCIDNGFETLTYAMLDAQSDILAACFLDSCGDAHSSVALLLGRSIDFVVSVVACIKAGITFVPIDPDGDPQRVQRMLSISDEPVVVHDDTRKWIQGHARAHVDLACIDDSVCPFDTRARLRLQPIYRIYTSGSTGIPKGVEIDDANIGNYVHWAKSYYQLDRSSVFALCTSTDVDLTITSYLLPLVSGGCIRIFSGRFDSVLAREILSTSSLTHIKLTPAHLKIMNALSEDAQPYPEKKCLIVGGEELEPKELRRRDVLFGAGCMVVNEYGPTETTVGCTAYTVPKVLPKVIPIGRPIDHATIVLMTDTGHWAKKEEIGEIYVGGRCVGRGYANDPKQTAERYVDLEGSRYYRTGDLGYISHEGLLVYCGREDRQVKINGRRIELGEIESSLFAMGGFDNLVVLYDDTYRRIVVYYESTEPHTEEGMHRYMVERFPAYKCPHVYVPIDCVPILASGKMDEQELLRIGRVYAQDRKSEKEVLDVVSIREQEILEMFADVLAQEKSFVDVQSTFVDLGGDSLMYIVLVEKLSQRYMTAAVQDEFIKRCHEVYGVFSVERADALIHEWSDARGFVDKK